MAAATSDRKINTTKIRRSFVGAVAAATIIYVGTLVAKNAAGNIVPASDTAALKVVGVALETVDNSAGAASAKTVQIGTGVFEFDNAGGAIVLASSHALCYVADNTSVTTAAVATNDIIAGLVDGFTSTKVLVDVDPVYAA
jgi:hypothetical protein